MKFHEMAAQTTRTRSNGKTSAYYRARAFDEALQGVMSATSALADMTAWLFWESSRSTLAQGKAGGFTVSKGEIARMKSDEKLMIRSGESEPRVVRGPDNGTAAFEKSVKAAWTLLKAIADGNKPLTAWLPHDIEWVKWNQGKLADGTDAPFEGNRTGNYAYPIIAEWTEADAKGVIDWIRANLRESIEDYKYQAPTD